nr:ABC transporter ATP-binding protein [uncultured Acetatifactor sp.]
MEIQIASLKKVYGKKAALDGITFSIGNGMYGLIGRNGAGKTTLMRILATLSRPSGGQVTFDGIPLEDTKKIRPFIGYLPQEFSLYPDMTVLEVMRYLAALSDIPGEVWRERIPRLLRQVNLWEDRTKKAGKLSGGMKRRLGIAQALLDDPQVLLVDEPTAGLDPEERLRFYALLDEFSGSRTVVVSSHIMSDIESVCENVAVLDAGRLLFAGTVGALAKKAEGKVYELAVPKKEQDAVKRDYYILSSQSHASDVKVRVLADGIPPFRPVSCAPTAWDGYMELLRQLEKGVGKG